MRAIALTSPSLDSPALPRGGALVPVSRGRVMVAALTEPTMPARKAPSAVALVRPLKPSRPSRVEVLPQQDRYVVRGRDLQRQEVLLPFGLPKATSKVSAATLKRLVGGSRRDQLLRKSGESWVFVDNRQIIDLNDETQVFRVGRLQILS